MAYPLRPAELTVSQSVDSIAQSEAIILQNLNEIFCLDFVAPLLEDETLTPEEKLTLISGILNEMAIKECAIANVIDALSDVLVVDKGLVKPSCKNSCTCCK